MQILNNEVVLESELYGNFCLLDGFSIKKYPQLDRGWIEPPPLKPDVKALVNNVNRDKTSSIWCVDTDNLKKTNIMSFEVFLHFPENVEPIIEPEALCVYTRLNPLYANTQKGIVTYIISKYIHWILRNKTNLYWYTYGNFKDNNKIINYCSKQTEFVENPLLNKNNIQVLKTYSEYDDSGKDLLLLTHNVEIAYNRYKSLNYIDKTLSDGIDNFINSI